MPVVPVLGRYFRSSAGGALWVQKKNPGVEFGQDDTGWEKARVMDLQSGGDSPL